MDIVDEDLIWGKLNQSRRTPLEPRWLGEVYSLNLQADLRLAITEQLGLLSNKGWPILQLLIKKVGAQPELIYAAGLCHQREAKKWLLKLLKEQKQLKLPVLQALVCWGGELPITLIKNVLNEKSQPLLLAGLELLKFKVHQLNDEILLDLVQKPLRDFRDPIVLSTLRVLQRRNSAAVNSQIADIAKNGSEVTARAAILALSCIATTNSLAILSNLLNELPQSPLRKMAQKQLQLQLQYKKSKIEKTEASSAQGLT